VLAEQPYSMWRGLTDLAPFRWLDHQYAARLGQGVPPLAAANDGQSVAAPPPRTRSRIKEWLKYAIFAEDRSIPGLGMLVSAGCELASNMRMYVCRRP